MKSETPTTLTRGQRLAISITRVMGSWSFIVAQSIMLVLWLGLNLSSHFHHHWDRPPFILLNVLLSIQAAFTGPVVLMAQNVSAVRDRILAETFCNELQRIREELHVSHPD